MDVQIERQSGKVVKFEELEPGNVFRQLGEEDYCVKTEFVSRGDGHVDVTTMRLSDGAMIFTDCDNKVLTPYSATIRIGE